MWRFFKDTCSSEYCYYKLHQDTFMINVNVDVFLCAEAIGDMNVCFILDGILILYGVILTVLYCRLRVRQTGTTHTLTTELFIMLCERSSE